MDKYHKQCLLMKNNGNQQIVWLPEKFAKINKILEINGDNGWVVIGVYSKEFSKLITGRSNGYLHQRKMSDI